MIYCEKCPYYSKRDTCDGVIGFCNDPEEFVNSEDGELCCRYHDNAKSK